MRPNLEHERVHGFLQRFRAWRRLSRLSASRCFWRRSSRKPASTKFDGRRARRRATGRERVSADSLNTAVLTGFRGEGLYGLSSNLSRRSRRRYWRSSRPGSRCATHVRLMSIHQSKGLEFPSLRSPIWASGSTLDDTRGRVEFWTRTWASAAGQAPGLSQFYPSLPALAGAAATETGNVGRGTAPALRGTDARGGPPDFVRLGAPQEHC